MKYVKKAQPIHRLRTLDELYAKTVHMKDTDCRVYKGSLNSGGYGSVTHAGKVWLTHRLAMHLHYGAIPPDAFVCHYCDNPACINVKHLYFGNAKTNAQDAVRRGRLKYVSHQRMRDTVKYYNAMLQDTRPCMSDVS